MLQAATSVTYSAIMRKANSLFLCKKYEESLDVIILIQEDVDNFKNLSDEGQLIFFNNVGVLYHFLRKPHLSSFYLNKARYVYLFRVNVFNSDINIREKQVFHSSAIYKVMCNVGLSLLFKKKPLEAFSYYRNAVQGMKQSSLVWLRLAECCIMAYKNDNDSSMNYLQKRNSLATCKVGSGLASKIVLNRKLYQDSAFSSDPEAIDDRIPSLGFAAICLKNSYTLLPMGNSKFKQAVLAASAYVHLTIGGPVKAYNYARMLNMESTFHVYNYLSKLYLAESLILMNRTQEAIDVLKPTQLSDWDSLNDLYEQKCCTNVQITSHIILNYNLAVALAVNGEFQKASELLRNVWKLKGPRSEVPIHIVALALYIELILGHIDVAKIIVKQNCPQLFQRI